MITIEKNSVLRWFVAEVISASGRPRLKPWEEVTVVAVMVGMTAPVSPDLEGGLRRWQSSHGLTAVAKYRGDS